MNTHRQVGREIVRQVRQGSVDFQWRAGTEDGEGRQPLSAETTSAGTGARPHTHAGQWRVVGALLLALAVTGGAWQHLHTRADQSEEACYGDLTAVAQAELRALVAGDAALYLTFQSPAAEDGSGEERFRREQAWLAQAGVVTPRSLRVVRAKLEQDLAWVRVGYAVAGRPYERVQVYRQMDGHWRRADPDARFWGEERELRTAHFAFFYHEPEEAAVIRLAQWAEALYASLRFGQHPTSERIVIALIPDPQTRVVPTRRMFLLWSPLLLGMRRDGVADIPTLAGVANLSYLWGQAEPVFERVPLGTPLAAVLAYNVATVLAYDAAGLAALNLQERLQANRLLLDAVAHYEVERLLPGLPQIASDAATLRDAVAHGRLLPLAALWEPAAYPDGGATGEAPRALVQLKSLVAFAEEESQNWYGSQHRAATTLLPRFLMALQFRTPEETIRFVLADDGYSGLRPLPPVYALYRAEPPLFIAAWHAWLAQRYG